MLLDSLFKSEKTYNASIQTLSQTNTNGVLGPKVWTTSKTVPCLFWRGGMSDVVISQKLKADVVGTILMRPSEINASEIPTNSRILLTDDTMYCAINHTDGYSAGTLTIVVDNSNDSKKPFKAKDVFTIYGEAGSIEHTISSTTKTSGVTTGITFTPAIATGGVLDNAVITLTPFVGYYSVIYPDNIAGQDEVIMIPVKEFI
ncbi:MAG: hypothetical protein PHE51_04920 [Eubacteriales bacterium]|nr:hypothetical protein [Eubacteriales bacterium]